MADDRNKNLGQPGGKGEGQQGGAHQSPGRNPQDDKSAGGRQGVQDMNRQGRQGDDGDAYKEGRQNEQTRR